jgi:magnesium transporter
MSYCIDKINDEFIRYVSHVENNAEIFKAKVSDLSQEHSEKVYRASVTSAFFQQALSANTEVLLELKKIEHKHVRKENIIRFHDLYYNILQIYDSHKIQRELLLNLFNLESNVVANRMNTSVKKFTSLAFVVMIPTLISGIFGMNFKYIWLAEHPLGFVWIVGLMLVISLGLWAIFKKLDLI